MKGVSEILPCFFARVEMRNLPFDTYVLAELPKPLQRCGAALRSSLCGKCATGS